MKQPGDRLGPYEIVAPIGSGAMGEVYRARDVRLQRDVALKVLSETLASEPSFLGRFEREARSVSAIDHPNVVAVHDVGRLDATAWIALELVEGPTLREMLEQGPLPLRRALALAAQVADGLAAAHERGVVHRDLKPANVKVTPDGLVKILDFGLAKVADGPAEGVAAAIADLEGLRTTPGVVLGTVGYMSPEQAAGKAVDFRCDQFALGTVLFEMLSGRAPFIRHTAAETLFAIIREETPPLPGLDPATEAPLRWILDRCLAKEPEARYASTRDLARDLHRLGEHLERSGEARRLAVPLAHPRRWIQRSVLPAVYAAAGAAIAAAIIKSIPPPVPFFQQLTFERGHVVAARFQPDWATVLYSAGWEGKPFSVYRKDPQGPESLLMDLPPGWLQAISPKGTVLLVTSPRILLPGRPLGTLAEGPLAGGAAHDVQERVQFADWDAAGDEMALVRERIETDAVTREVKSAKTVLEFPRGRVVFTAPGWISSPRISRSGSLVAFVDHPIRADDRGHVVVVDRAGKERLKTRLWSVAKGLDWSPDGDEVWFAASPGEELSALRAVTMDGKVRLLARAPGPLTLLDVAPNGDALVARETRHFLISALMPDGATRELSWLDSSLLADLSDDGRTVLFTEFGESGGRYHSTFVRDLGDPRATRLGQGLAKALSPDKTSALSITIKESPELMILPTGAGEQRTLNHRDLTYHSAGFLPDGQRILVAANEADKGVRLYVQELAGGTPRVVSPEGIAKDHFQGFPVSPDGKWVATVEEPLGGIALRALEHDDKRILPALAPGTLPVRWTSDGRGLFVFRPDEVPARVLRVDIVTGTARPWLTVAPPDRTGVHIFPVLRLSADGRTCVYSYARLLTVLYRVTGLR